MPTGAETMNGRRRSHFQVEEATNWSFGLVALSGLWCVVVWLVGVEVLVGVPILAQERGCPRK